MRKIAGFGEVFEVLMELCMQSNKMLEAEKHNWGLIGYGNWRSVTRIVNYGIWGFMVKYNNRQR